MAHHHLFGALYGCRVHLIFVGSAALQKRQPKRLLAIGQAVRCLSSNAERPPSIPSHHRVPARGVLGDCLQSPATQRMAPHHLFGVLYGRRVYLIFVGSTALRKRQPKRLLSIAQAVRRLSSNAESPPFITTHCREPARGVAPQRSFCALYGCRVHQISVGSAALQKRQPAGTGRRWPGADA